MITIKVIGLDQFIVGRLSKETTKNLANLYEVSSDDINFVAPNCMIFHEGVEQTSWHVMLDIMAPKKTQVLQADIAKYLISAFKDVAINVEVIFHYYSVDDRVVSFNNEYPRYIKESNVVDFQTDDNEYEEGEEDDQIYTGNIFEDILD